MKRQQGLSPAVFVLKKAKIDQGMTTMTQGILGADVLVQIGIVVKDIEKTAKDYAEFFGVEVPQIIETDEWEKAHTEYNGHPTKARAKLVFFKNFKNIEIELIQPNENPSTWREFLDKHGEGIHHVAILVKNMDEKLESLKKIGIGVLQKGDYEGGRYAYVNSVEKLKFILELLENY
ncbi:methylmalonyl-CoA epimerase [Pseudothermotoga thermarum DSM 5069]|uniref:Methylmalonyl-CoA epimerase n=1 Tax=Pseudothermotoga thermarum DSM 5069 TaxID=688269 RepID=F7YTZ1_9THEM|nr:VOC family protein [Pseudothermotoga thermarum]AEH51573.1 methylmalonyl-CoA epimerase [Pseudothermotoga thermarum DSM 5069]